MPIAMRKSSIAMPVCGPVRATTSQVIIDVNGAKLFASITNEAVADLGREVGKAAVAIIKASDVMVAIA